MKPQQAIEWFKENFQDQIEPAVAATPFSADLVAAIAYQETGKDVWSLLIGKQLPIPEILALCVGDTIDRDEFPSSKGELLQANRGAEMFQVAREALEAIAEHSPPYRAVAQAHPNKFCHGFGIFQYDIQFFREAPADPEFFLERKWRNFGDCLEKLIGELRAATRKLFGPSKNSLTDDEEIYVGIAYNQGHAKVGAGFAQGFKDDDGFYGENIFQYREIARNIAPSSGGSEVGPQPAVEIKDDPAIVFSNHKPDDPEMLARVKNFQRMLNTQPGISLVADGAPGTETSDAVNRVFGHLLPGDPRT